MTLHRSSQMNRAMTLLEAVVVIFVIAFLVLMLLPTSRSPRQARQALRINCINNLKQVAIAYRIWTGDHTDKFPMEVSVTNGGTMELFTGGSRFQNLVFLNYLVMSNELSTPKILHCPADTYGFAAASFSGGFNNQNVSYFVGTDAKETAPAAILSGDDNLQIGGVPVKSGLLRFFTNDPIAWTAARHKLVGNIGLADGSVQAVTSGSLHTWLFPATGLATNRLAIP